MTRLLEFSKVFKENALKFDVGEKNWSYLANLQFHFMTL